MGKQAMPLHHYTLPHLRCLYSHSLSVALFTVAVCFFLSIPIVNYALHSQTCSRCARIHLQGCIIRTLATWAIFYPREVHQEWPTAGCRWPFLRGLDGPLLDLAGLYWAGSVRYGHRPSLGSTDPHYQLPSSSPSCMLPFRCCAASLSSHVYF